MLNQLYEMARAVVDRPVDIKHLDRYGGQPNSAGEATKLAIEFSRVVRQGLRSKERTIAEEGVISLLDFIAEMPGWLRDEIRREKGYPDRVPNAWVEAECGGYVALCTLVQDVWEHFLGPESESDTLIEEAIFAEAPGNVLDFGSGAGHFAMTLAKRGTRVTCIETGRVKREFLRRRATRSGVSARIRLGEPRPPFDTALAINVFDHLLDPSAGVVQIAGMLADGGRLIHVSSFPDDGWHQSAPELVERTFQELFRCFSLTTAAFPTGTCLEVLRKGRGEPDWLFRADASADYDQLLARPHPSVSCRPMPEEPNRFVLFAPRFYVKPCFVDETGLAIFQRFDGKRTIGDVRKEMDMDDDEMWPLVEFLWRNRIIAVGRPN